ncbi:hypothetical protein ACQ4PT_027020 [Festuca glaucescens]
MDTRVPPVPMDPATAAKFRRRRQDPDDLEGVVARVLSRAHYVLPDPPAAVDAHLSALLPHDGVDRLSHLPDVLLANIVSHIPIKEAARTAALSRHWRGIWRSAPLVLVDSQILPAGTEVARADARRITSAVSGVFVAHPGPFHCVHLTSSCMEEFHACSRAGSRYSPSRAFRKSSSSTARGRSTSFSPPPS